MSKLKIVNLGSIDLPPLKSDIFSILLPSNLFFLEAFFRVDIRFHAPGEETLIFLEVTDVDLVLQQLLPPLDPKIEPLEVSCRVTVYPHEAIVLTITHSHHAVKVPSLKEGVEYEIVFCLPMLSAEGTVRKLHVIWCLNVVIWKTEWLVVPCIVGVLVTRSQIAQLCPCSRLL